MEPEIPGELCSLSGDTLLYLDKSQTPREIRLLDCGSKTPKYVKSIYTEQAFVSEMCCTKWNGKKLLVFCNSLGIYAYNIKSGNLEWSVSGRVDGMEVEINPYGLTVDEKGHVFVSDFRFGAIYVFSMDGEYLGVLMKEGECSLGKPGCLRWCPNSSYLVVTHFMDNAWFLHVLNIQ